MRLRRPYLSFDPGLLVTALLPLIGLIPTFGDGIIKTADGPLHVQRIYAMSVLLEHGHLWPRWVSWFHLGYGYPVFNFYPPGVFYLGGLLGLIGVSIPLAFNLVAALAWILGSMGTYALAKRFLPVSGALLAAALWAYAPSRLYEVWDQGSLPQMLAAACVPWIFLGLTLAAQNPSRRSLLALALPTAGMILSHQPITLITGLFIAPAALVLPLAASWRDRRTFARRFACVIGGLALGAGLAAIFLIPLALELKYVQAAAEAPDVIPYLRSNFLQPGQLFIQPPPVDLTDLRYKLPTTLGLAGGILCALGLLALVRTRRWGLLAALVAALAFALLMMVELSLPVWQAVPFMAQLRFPERFLRVAAVFLALGSGASLLLFPRRWQMAGLAGGLILVIAAGLPMAYPSRPFVNWPNLSALDEIRMEETEHTWGSTSYDEFNPVWGEKPGWDPAVEPEEYVNNPLRIVVNRLDMIRQWPDLQVEQVDAATVRVTVTGARPVRFRQFYFPGWTALLDGQPVPIYPEPELGQITVDVPEGTHLIALAYTGTTAQAVGALVTLASIGVAIVLMVYSRNHIGEGLRPSLTERLFHEGEGGTPARAFPPRPAALFALAIVAFTLVNSFIITPHTLLFRRQSPPDQPAAMQTPVNVRFGDTFALLGYTLEQTSTAPGGLLPVTLYWRALQPVDKEYRPVVQLVNLSQTAAWAVSEPLFPGGGKTTTYTPDRFASDVHALRLFPDAPPYVGRISVQMVDSGTGDPLRLPDGSDRLLLPPLIRVTGAGAALPPVLNYRFDDAVELACATIQREGDTLTIDLGWRVLQTPAQDVTVFVHGLGANGQPVEQNDSPPLGLDYPASLWQPGQTLLDHHTLLWDDRIQLIAIGLYTPERRLTVTRDSQPVPDNRVLLALDENSCSR
ncbi:MAG: hypothetical protein HZC41_20540 [Chloroflexi bacterium]|nr:hypothetical protein [Chloroflexota bacterium]